MLLEWSLGFRWGFSRVALIIGAFLLAGFLPNGASAGSSAPPFHMTKGRGISVCEAYLQRLNTTDYTPPHSYPMSAYDDIPESDTIPGFTLLHRVSLAPSEIIQMSGELTRWWEHINPALGGNWDLTPEIAKSEGQVAAWRYAPPLDIDNDGKPDDLIVWRGAGLGSAAGRCGEPFNQNYTWGFRCRQMPLLMQSGQHVDQAGTAEMFGRVGAPDAGQGKKSRMRHPFIPVGYFIAPFEYQGTAYFSAFFDNRGDYEGKRQGIPQLWNTLGVLVRSKGTTQEVCEYQLAGDDYPKTDTGLED